MGIGRECGNPKLSPSCNCLNSIPISLRASLLIGGVFTSPCSQRNGFSSIVHPTHYIMSELTYRQMPSLPHKNIVYPLLHAPNPIERPRAVCATTRADDVGHEVLHRAGRMVYHACMLKW
jgi:hypothetical protein